MTFRLMFMVTEPLTPVFLVPVRHPRSDEFPRPLGPITASICPLLNDPLTQLRMSLVFFLPCFTLYYNCFHTISNPSLSSGQSSLCLT